MLHNNPKQYEKEERKSMKEEKERMTRFVSNHSKKRKGGKNDNKAKEQLFQTGMIRRKKMKCQKRTRKKGRLKQIKVMNKIIINMKRIDTEAPQKIIKKKNRQGKQNLNRPLKTRKERQETEEKM